MVLLLSPAVPVVAPAMPVAHLWALLSDVDVIQSPLVLLAVVVLDPAEPCGTGPAKEPVQTEHQTTARQRRRLDWD